ncbi:adenylate/guanylate cyclase domain-containing protein [Limnoraphis robusta]|uniref:Adenylate/guanylate cyclase domain-containing protein n=1 Tax=Limnoraphis robusta CCNP1315 TaxID=3110306 RepID=A0ABU5U8U8_9CYAN|nr:adenylate/guanylate cyclase domain-containing protein [Limnoraphis robusta]MEA5522523.1 adenylate/guanylate cyclase domain-containing protein [Limnoraphis robusta CCNP1315]MEA5548266.1 adenylate/guanylate cyclase domain-containing protein [Limnoraphis robusta CCNP1324]
MNAYPESSLVLIVDDNEVNRDLLARRIKREGCRVILATNGFEALEMMRSQPLDLVLLDIMMPQMNGYQVLEALKADQSLRYIPVIMISAVNDIESVVRCIELGAEDYLSKPFNPVLLRARINACLEKKRLRDQERAYLKKLAAEQEKSEQLLLNILPKAIAERLKRGESTIADSFDDVTVLFGDIANFTKLSADLSPAELVEILNRIFSRFDELADKYHLEKIKTLGDAYMVVGGLPTPQADHVEAIAEMALDMQQIIGQFSLKEGEPLQMRIGINTGPVEAGVIGMKKFTYDLWGDTVNTANRMESHGISGKIQVTATTYERLKEKYLLEERGTITVKGKGQMLTYFLTGRKASDQ